MHRTYTFIGSLKNGESIFRSKTGSLAIEKDHCYLVEATPEELVQVYEIYPHLNPDPFRGAPSQYALFVLSAAIMQAASRTT